MKVVVNGKEETYPETSLTVSELLKKVKVEMPDQVSVQQNGNFVDRQVFSETIVSDGDEMDFLYFLGGGCQ